MTSQSAAPTTARKPPKSEISTAHRVVAPEERFPFRSLTPVYLIGLGVIALWAIGSQVLIQVRLAHQQGDAHVAVLAGRQRMLAERLCKAALVLRLSSSPKERQEQTQELDDSVAALTQVQSGLAHGDAHLGIPSNTDPRILGLLKSVDPNMAVLLAAAHQIQHLAHRKPMAADAADLLPACQKLLAAERGYVTGMDAVATEYDAQAQAHVAGTQQMSLLLTLGAIGLLVLEALFLFKPAARAVGAQLGQAKKAAAKIAEQNAKIEAQRAELQSHHDALSAHEADLAAAALRLSQADTRLSQAAAQSHALFHGLPVACYAFDTYGRAVDWNKSCETLYQRPKSEALQQPLWEMIVPPHAWDTFRDTLAAVLRGASGEHEWDQVRADGSRVPVLSSMFPVHGPGGEIVGGICATIDLSFRKQYENHVQENAATLTEQREALEKANERLRTLAAEDGVTGLKNHRLFHEGLTKEFARIMDSGCREPLSVVLLDVDAFKHYNDNFGHGAGDDVLRRIAQILTKSARGTDLVSRYGGEEFAVILSQTDRRGAMAYAERVRASIAAAPWSFQAVTASVGVTTLSFDTPSAAALIAEADAALGRSKATGRNRVTFAGDPIAAETPATASAAAKPNADTAAA